MHENSSPELSILIISWNCYEDTRLCLESITHSDAQDYEIVIIDNASSDNTVDYVRSKFPQVNIVVNDRNVGHTKAVNQGLKLVRGNYVLLLDADTELAKDAIPEMLKFLKDHPDTDLVAPRTFNTDGSVQNTARNFPNVMSGIFGRQSFLTRVFPNNPFSRRYLKLDFLATNEPFQVESVSSACMFFRRPLVDEVGYWDEGYPGYWVDTDWCMQLKEQGRQVYCVPSAVITHHEQNRRGKKKSPRRIRMFHNGAYRFYTKHYTYGRLDPRSVFALIALTARAYMLILQNYFLPTEEKGIGQNTKVNTEYR